jgi:hypothetical protein
MDMRFGTWSVIIYGAVGEEISKYKLHLVGVQEIRWDRGGTEPAGKCTFFYGKGNGNHELSKGFLYLKRIISVVNRAEFVGDKMSYITLRGRWCDIILNFHAPMEDKIVDIKDRFYEDEVPMLNAFADRQFKSLNHPGDW